MNNILKVVLIIFSLSIIGGRIVKGIILKQNVTGYIKRAADANTIDLAEIELTKAIGYLEKNNLTSGYTSIVYQTPDEDIDFWYRNLKASQNELQTLHSESALERTNVLMKLRETLLDTGQKTRVTVPKGLSVYPNNILWVVLMTLSIISLIIGFIGIALKYERKSMHQKHT